MRHLKIVFVFCIALLLSSRVDANDNKLDIVIKGGRVVDGTGSPWYLGDLGIEGGIIVRSGNIPADDAETIIDATGLIVAPGFVDMTGQTASPMLDDPKTAINLLTQGTGVPQRKQALEKCGRVEATRIARYDEEGCW